MNFLLTENRLKNDLSNSSLSVMWFIFEMIIAIFLNVKAREHKAYFDLSQQNRSERHKSNYHDIVKNEDLTLLFTTNPPRTPPLRSPFSFLRAPIAFL
jgi:hypothetical protein